MRDGRKRRLLGWFLDNEFVIVADEPYDACVEPVTATNQMAPHLGL